MELFKITGHVKIIEQVKQIKISETVLALSAEDAYLAIAGESDIEQTDMFDPVVNLPGAVFFCGIKKDERTWVCPLTGGLICVGKV